MAITMKQNEMHTVFVYGTLKTDHANHAHFMSDAKYIGAFKTNPKWGLLDLGPYPAMVMGGLAVQGELYQVDSDTLERLDRLEGVASGLYSRKRINVNRINMSEGVPLSGSEKESVVPAWVYIYHAIARQGAPLMEEW